MSETSVFPITHVELKECLIYVFSFKYPMYRYGNYLVSHQSSGESFNKQGQVISQIY